MKIFLSSKADKQLDKLPKKMYDLLLNKIEGLSTDPFPGNSQKLEGRSGWRIRVGDYRILYSIDQKKRELTILSVAHRKEAYKY